MTISVGELRRKYPEPLKSSPEVAAVPGNYCVGGALALELGCVMSRLSNASPGVSTQQEQGRVAASLDGTIEPTPLNAIQAAGMFPDPPVLATLLMQANPVLTLAAAGSFARTIVRKNDTGNFETAWGLLGDALTWTEEWTDADTAAMREFAETNA